MVPEICGVSLQWISTSQKRFELCSLWWSTWLF